MDKALGLAQWILANYEMIIASSAAILLAAVGLLSACLSVALIIPGDQPDKFLQSCVNGVQKAVDFVSKFSKKSAAPEQK